MPVKGRRTPQQRRAAREARAQASAPPAPKVNGQFVEITGPAKVDVEDPQAGHLDTDHQGAVGELEGTYYNAEREEHMGRVRVGQRSDGSGGQLRGIPLTRLKGITAQPVKPRETTRVSMPRISENRWNEIFGEGPKPNVMSDAERQRLRAEAEATMKRMKK